MLVSYVVTLYNKAPFVPHMLASLAAQRGDFARRHVFVDDGSTDETLAVLRDGVAGWPDVEIVQQANAGPAKAMNRGLALAIGDYVKPLDGDDVLSPWATQHLIAAIESSGCAVAYADMRLQGRYDPAQSSAEVLAAFDPAPPPVRRVDDMLARSLKSAQTNPSAWLARRDRVVAAGGCDERIFIQDYSIELRLAALGPFARLDGELFQQPRLAAGRLSENEAQTLHDVNLAVLNLLRDQPSLARRYVRQALRQASGRAWHWARRNNGTGPLSRQFALFLLARSLGLRPSPALRRQLLAPFGEKTALRGPQAG